MEICSLRRGSFFVFKHPLSDVQNAISVNRMEMIRGKTRKSLVPGLHGRTPRENQLKRLPE